MLLTLLNGTTPKNWINVGGAWRATRTWVNLNGTWVATQPWINIGGSWKV